MDSATGSCNLVILPHGWSILNMKVQVLVLHFQIKLTVAKPAQIFNQLLGDRLLCLVYSGGFRLLRVNLAEACLQRTDGLKAKP